MKKEKIDTYERVKKQLNDASGFLVYAMGHWDKDGFSAKNDSANVFFKMAMDNLKSVADNTEYDSVWFNRESLEACQNELNKLNMTGVFYELKKLIANGLRYSIMEEIGHIDKITEELFMNLLIEEINS